MVLAVPESAPHNEDKGHALQERRAWHVQKYISESKLTAARSKPRKRARLEVGRRIKRTLQGRNDSNLDQVKVMVLEKNTATATIDGHEGYVLNKAPFQGAAGG